MDTIYNGFDLKTCSIFDICEDKKYLESVLAPEMGIDSKEAYLEMIISDPMARILDLLYYAEAANKMDLLDVLEELYAEELDSDFED